MDSCNPRDEKASLCVNVCVGVCERLMILSGPKVLKLCVGIQAQTGVFDI